MHIYTKVLAHLSFRIVWQILTLPLEVLHMGISMLSYAVRSIALRRGIVMWVCLLVLFLSLPPMQYADNPNIVHNKEFDYTVAYGGLLLFLGRRYPYFFLNLVPVIEPRWRLQPYKMPHIQQNPVARIIVRPHGAKQNREKATHQLSPALQKLLSE